MHEESKLLARLKTQLGSAGFKRYFFNTSWMMAEQGLRLFSGLFVGIYVARYLGPEQFGLYSYALAFVSIFGVIAKLGLDGIVVRELVNSPVERDELLGTAFWLKVLGAFLAIVLVSAMLPWSSNDSITNVYILIIASGLVLQSFEVVDFYYQSLVQVKYISICKTIQLIISASVKLYLVHIESDLLLFVIVTLLDQVFLSLAYIFLVRIHKFINVFLNFRVNRARLLLTDSLPLILSGLAVMLYMRIDQVMIKEMLGAEEVGVYSAAVRLSEAWYFFPTVVASSLFPFFLKVKKYDISKYHSRLMSVMLFLVALSVSYSLAVIIFGKDLIIILYGNSFIGAYDVLVVHAWSSVLVSLGVVSGKWLLAENMSKEIFQRVVLGAILNVFLNYPLIHNFGIVGSAWATLIAQIFAAYFFDLMSKKTRPMFLMKTQVLMFNILAVVK